MVERMLLDTKNAEEEKAEPGGMRQDECVHSSGTDFISVCTLVRHHVSPCEWGGMLAGTLVYRHGPGSGGSEHGSKTVGRLWKPLPAGPPLALFCRCVPSRC